MGDNIPLHPAVAELLNQVADVGEGRVGFPADALASCRSRLLTELREDPVVFLNLLVAWSRFSAQKIEPATAQLYELVLIFPQVQEAKDKEELLTRARTAARAADEHPASHLMTGLAAPTSKSSGVGRHPGPKKR